MTPFAHHLLYIKFPMNIISLKYYMVNTYFDLVNKYKIKFAIRYIFVYIQRKGKKGFLPTLKGYGIFKHKMISDLSTNHFGEQFSLSLP